MRLLSLVLLALALCVASAEELRHLQAVDGFGSGGRGGFGAGGFGAGDSGAGGRTPGRTGGAADDLLRSEKISDAALATEQAVLAAHNIRMGAKKAAVKGNAMAAAAANPTVSHKDVHDMEASTRRLTAAEHFGGGFGVGGANAGGRVSAGNAADALRSEKISDAALATEQAVLAAHNIRMGAKKAAVKGNAMAAAAANPTVSHKDVHDMEASTRRMLRDVR